MIRFAYLLPLALMACQPVPVTPTSPPTPNAPADSLICQAGNYQNLVGQHKDIFARMIFPRSLTFRIIGPGDAVTLDYREDRVNFLYNERGIITEVKCY